MLMPENELSINRLSDALCTGFEWIVKRDREIAIGDIAEARAELTASALQDVRMMAPPIVDHSEPQLLFIETQRRLAGTWHLGRSRGWRWGAHLRARIRDLVRNNPHAAKAVSVLVSNIVGAGIVPRATSGNDKLDRKVDALSTGCKP